MRGRVLQPGRRQPIQMPGRSPSWRVGLPPRLQQAAIGEPHQDRVQRARPEPDLKSQLIAVAPRQRIGRERLDNLNGLTRRAAISDHVPKSIYVEIKATPPHPCQIRSARDEVAVPAAPCPPTRWTSRGGPARRMFGGEDPAAYRPPQASITSIRRGRRSRALTPPRRGARLPPPGATTPPSAGSGTRQPGSPPGACRPRRSRGDSRSGRRRPGRRAPPENPS
jgi:hypothetical protein